MKAKFHLSIDEKFYYERISFNGKNYFLKKPLKEIDEGLLIWMKAKSPRIFEEERTEKEIKEETKEFEKS